jgi:hypothetical protein
MTDSITTPELARCPNPPMPGIRALALSTALALLVACGGNGGGSSQSANAPTAIITPIGYKAISSPTSTACSSATPISVRAGADVALTGENSDGGGNISITGFSWQHTDSAPTPSVNFIYRNSSTVSFTAPWVAQDTCLNLQLTVTNALGLSGKAPIQVLVKADNDPNRFLSLLATPHHTPHHLKAALSLTTAATSSGDPVPLASDAPVCVKLTPSISYVNRNGATSVFPLPVQQVDAKWLASVGATAGFPTNSPAYLAFRNPVVSFDLPVLNDDVLFAKFNQPGATTADIANELVPSDIDSAYVKMSVSAAPGSCDGSQSGAALAGVQLMLQLRDEGQPGDLVVQSMPASPGEAVTVNTSPIETGNSPPPDPLTTDHTYNLTPDDFLRIQSTGSLANPSIETRESAAAYYAAIDPDNKKTTLTSWLASNCFDLKATNFGVGETGFNVVHAAYTNNFDLGFGRDMYFATCANGNMASVVVNYPSLEAVANKLGAFLAVAMEYSPVAGSTAPCFGKPADPTTNTGACFTKFYSFAPDDRTGIFNRVLSANFDRRGQKYLPGACTACHGGVPSFTPGPPETKYSSGPRGVGDVDSGFLPWDIGSLLFADANTPNSDPSFACTVSASSPACASINPSLFTQAAQEPNIQKLNALAFRTYDIYSSNAQAEATAGVLRFQAPVDLLTKWYGGDPAAASAHAFDDSKTPTSWATPGQSAPNDLYHQVFAHYCRSCHTMNDIPSEQFSTYAGFTSQTGAKIGGFSSFLTTPDSAFLKNAISVQQLVFKNGEMPLSRLTDDRFWVNFNGGTTAAQTLAIFINSLQSAPRVALDSDQNPVGPGRPLVMPLEASNPTPQSVLAAGSQNAMTRFQGASLDALTQSLFVASYQWSLCTGGSPPTPGGPCPGTNLGLIGTPLPQGSNSAGPPQSGASLPAFATVVPDTYFLTLTADNGFFGATPLSTSYEINVPQQAPALLASTPCPQTQANFDGTPITIDVSACFKSQGDAPYTLQVSFDGTTYSSVINDPSLPWNASVHAGICNARTCPDPNTGRNNAAPTIAFTFTPNATTTATVHFKWCDSNTGANSCAVGSASVTLATALSASAATFLGYWAPTDANYGMGGFSFTFPSGALAINPSASPPGMSMSGLNSYINVNAPSVTLSLGALSDGGAFNTPTLTGSSTTLPPQIHQLTYEPGGSFVTCDITGIDLSTGNSCTAGQSTSGVAFPYTLTDNGTSATANSTGTINIRALTSFQSGGVNSIFSILGSTCTGSGCHSSGGTGTNRWTYTTGDASATFSSIASGIDHNNGSNKLVNAGQPASSAFYTATCMGTDSANGMPQQFATTSSQCQILYQWILEGGQLD